MINKELVGRPIKIVRHLGIARLGGGLNACPDGLGHLFTATAVILQIFSNWSQSARFSAGGGGVKM